MWNLLKPDNYVVYILLLLFEWKENDVNYVKLNAMLKDVWMEMANYSAIS